MLMPFHPRRLALLSPTMTPYETLEVRPEFDKRFTVRAPAKINVRLKVTGRREDGYHLLSMLNVGVGLYDEIGISVKEKAGITLTIENAAGGAPVGVEDNVVCKAAARFFERTGVAAGLDIELKKHIPAGAGLGGGSSDAAAVLGFLAKFF